MKNYISKLSVAALAAAMVLGMSGCSSDSSSSPAAVDDGGDTVSYAGSRTLTGSVDTSSLSAQDQAENRSRSRNSRADDRAEDDELVKLYVLDANGSYEDTGIDCTIDTAGEYTCANIAGDQEYVVRYVKDLGDGRVLEMKTSATVPENSDPDPVKIDPITTMVVEAIVKAVEDAIVGLDGGADLVASIIESVKTAIVDTMQTLVQTGVIQIPSLVVDGNFTEIEEAEVTAEIVEVDNSSLDNIAAIVTTDEDVAVNIDAIKSDAEGDKFSGLTDAEKMDSVFQAMGWDKDMPQWVIDLFSGEFNNMDASWTFAWLMSVANVTAVDAGDLDMNDYELKIFDNAGITASVLAGYATDAATAANTKLNDGSLLTELRADILAYHAVKAKAIADRTDADNEFLSHFPAAVGEMFPLDFATAMTATTPIANMGQFMLVFGYLDIRDGDLGDFIKDQLIASIDDDSIFEGAIENAMEELFDDGGPEFLEVMYPRNEDNTTNDTMAQYDTISVSWIDGASQNQWNHETNTEKTTLRLSTGLSKLEWDLEDSGVPAGADVSAELTYPSSTGEQTVALALHADPYDDDNRTFFGIMPMIQNPDFDQDAGWTAENQEWIENTDTTQVITDFVTGDYTVTFTYEGETFSRTEQLYFIANAHKYNAELINPKGTPQWNSDWDNIRDWNDPDLNATMKAEYDAYEIANQAYWQDGVPTFSPNTDTDADDVNDTLKGMVVQWNAPDLGDLVLPDNIELAYNVNVRLFSPTDTNGDGTANWEDCNENWDACNTDIYSTWNDDKLVTGTSMRLPVDLRMNDVNTPESNYEINVNVMFVNKDTGREIANGGGNHAQFKVGESTALTGSENITFSGEINFSEWRVENGDDNLSANMKVGLFGETWGETIETVDGVENTYWKSERTLITLGDVNATSNTFSVDSNISVLQDHIGMNKGIQIVAFEDANDDGEWQDWESVDENGTYNGENSYWLYNSWMHIDSWGDTTIRVGHHNPETDEQSEESIRVKTGEDANVSGLSIMIW